jgi:hypothetical protein
MFWAAASKASAAVSVVLRAAATVFLSSAVSALPFSRGAALMSRSLLTALA